MRTIGRCSIMGYLRFLLVKTTSMEIHEKFGKIVSNLRKEKGYSQERFAFETNIARKYMSDIENGKRNISLDVIKRIADKLEMPISELFALAEMIE